MQDARFNFSKFPHLQNFRPGGSNHALHTVDHGLASTAVDGHHIDHFTHRSQLILPKLVTLIAVGI